jgi:hypothetical protein
VVSRSAAGELPQDISAPRGLSLTLVSHRFVSHNSLMQAVAKSDFVSVAQYLAAEEASDVRHEY